MSPAPRPRSAPLRLASCLALGLALLGPGAAAAQVHHGELAPGDEQLGSGEYVDRYLIDAEPGDVIVLELVSDDFDPYLLLRGPGGQQQDNDDAMPGDLSRSRIEFPVLERGTFEVGVTTFQPGERGRYVVTIRALPPPPRRIAP